MNWNLLFSTFGLIFLAELGDKTQLAVVVQTCKFRRPWSVFLGASLALIGVTALGAVGGQILGTLIPIRVIQIVAGLAFIVMGIFVWRESTRNNEDLDCEIDDCEAGWESIDNRKKFSLGWKAFSSTMSLLFLAELGDKTQLAVIGLSSEQAQPWTVFLGGALALSTVTALGVLGGRQLTKIIPQHILLKASAVLFVFLGVLMGLGML